MVMDHQELLGHLFDPDNPISLARKLPERLCAVLMALVTSDSRLPLLVNDEDDLLAHLKDVHNHVPTVNDHRIRFHFWLEYERAVAEGDEMIPRNIHALVCSETAFRRMFLGLGYRAAFLLCRPAGYQKAVQETLHHGLKKMREILDLPIHDSKGKLNTKLLEIKTKVFTLMDMRVNGAPMQKIHQVNQTLNQTQTNKTATESIAALAKKGDMASIQRRMYELEEQEKRINQGAVGSPALVAIPARREPEAKEAVLVEDESS